MASGQPPFHYGGQAVLEGVMIRGERHLAVAVRRPDGEVVTRVEALHAELTGRLRKVPLVRGIVVLGESLVLGVKTLLYSASVALGEEEKPPSLILWLALGVALVIGVALFMIGPLFLARWLDHVIASSLVSNLVEGVFRLAVFLAYLGVISLMPEIRRVFAYHGAEHKAINAYEAGAPLEPEALAPYSTAHARCGTAFVLTVLVLAVFLFALLGRPSLPLRVLSRVALLPVLASLSYEAMRLSANHMGNRLVRAIFSPGLALQALTTRQPDRPQLEVALAALHGALQADGRPAGETKGPTPQEVADQPQTGPQDAS